MKPNLKIFLVLILITNFLSCKENFIEEKYQIVFDRYKKVIIPEELKKDPFDPERFEEIFNSLPGEFQIVIMDEDGKNQRVLKKEIVERRSVSIEYPFWSPDGKDIFFLLIDELESKVYICIMNADGTNIRKLANEKPLMSHPSLSPKGDKIAYSLKETDKYKIYIIDSDGRNRIKVTNNTFTNDLSPAWSPDGKKIVFISSEEIETAGKIELIGYPQGDIYTLDIEGKNLKKLTDNEVSKIWCYGCWSPDGEKIVYTAFCDNNYEIFVIDKDGNNKKRLTYNSVDDFVPTWSPDGKKIAFISDGMLYLMDPDGKNQVKLTDKTQCYVSYGVWSPDSKKIAFVAEGDIYTIDIDGRNLKNLTNTPDWEEANPSWQPIPKD